MSTSVNDDAWVKVPLWGLLGYTVSLAVALPLSGGAPGRVAERLLVPTVVATGLVVVVATSWRRRWSWKGYAATAPVAVAVLAVALAAVSSLDPARDTSVATATPKPLEVVASPSPVAAEATGTAYPTFSAHLVAPADGANWVRLTGPQTQAADAQTAQWTAGLYGLPDVVAGSYEHTQVPGARFRYVGVNGHIAADSREAAGRAALVSTIGNHVVAFPPQADGWLGCNGGAAQGSPGVSCAWVGNDAAVFLRWADTKISLGQAASMTRAFRDFVATQG